MTGISRNARRRLRSNRAKTAVRKDVASGAQERKDSDLSDKVIASFHLLKQDLVGKEVAAFTLLQQHPAPAAKVGTRLPVAEDKAEFPLKFPLQCGHAGLLVPEVPQRHGLREGSTDVRTEPTSEDQHLSRG
jgi:hypothetical protein